LGYDVRLDSTTGPYAAFETIANMSGVPRSHERAARFLRRIDAYLPTLRDAQARRDFLKGQIDGWERRYARFLLTEGGSEPVPDSSDPPQAADFVLTIQGLAKRRCGLPNVTGERTMIATAQQRLERAMLSLLVAADQRCPAIIGQAHLLYHAHGHQRSTETEKALTLLKSEAQDLLAAIAHAELEMKRPI
jgi:hypothetical protein